MTLQGMMSLADVQVYALGAWADLFPHVAGCL